MMYYDKHDYHLGHCKVLEFNKYNVSETGSHQAEKFQFSR